MVSVWARKYWLFWVWVAVSDLNQSSGFKSFNYTLMFCSSHFWFWFLVTFVDEVMKILRNLCLHFARQDGQDGKKRKENHATKVTKIPKTKRRKYGMNETLVYN